MRHLQYTTSFFDKIHGDIRLTEEEKTIIDFPDFQRLRRISQTGLAYMAWPSATHTRFEHSIGVLRYAQKMLNALNLRSKASAAKLYSILDAKAGQAVRLHDLDQDVPLAASIQRLTRICALVHDLGHGPFSHAFQALAPLTSDVEQFIGDPRLAPLHPLRATLLASKTGRITHEATSCILFAAIWHDMGGEPWVPAVVASVLSDAPISDAVPRNLRPWVPLIRDLISSSPIDADRLDYLERDSVTMGVKHGLADSRRILKSILCIRNGTDAEPTYRLAWRKSGLRAIECAMFARFQMFVQVYYHHTVRGGELMIKEMSKTALGAGIVLFNARTLDEFREHYALLGEEVFLQLLAGRIRPGFPEDGQLRELAARILDRRLWKRVFEFDADTAQFAPHLLSDLQRAFPEFKDDLFIDTLELRATKGLDDGAPLLVFNDAARYFRPDHAPSWIQASPTMAALRDDERCVVRIFLKTARDVIDCPPQLPKEAIRLLAQSLPAAKALPSAPA